jgi:two-component system phosphate regulon sensor histidine kinase PhoR
MSQDQTPPITPPAAPAPPRSLLRRLVALLRGPWRSRQPPDALASLWDALARSPRDCTEPGQDAWAAAIGQVRRQRQDLTQSLHLQLQLTTARAQAQMTQAVLAALQDGVVVLDNTERVLYANATARRVLQISDQQNITLEQATSRFEIVEGMRSVLGADLARSVKTCRIEWEAEERRFVYLIRSLATPTAPELQHLQIVVLEDWTAEERAARAKSEFIYGVSHELKTPLTAIQASLELANEAEGIAPEDRDKLIKVSYEESVRLSQMVAELLDLARIEAGITEFKHEQVNMRDLFDSLQSLHLPLAERRGITLRWDISDYLADLTGDTRLLRQAMVNIVGNALKYTKQGGEVSLTARLEGAELVTRVRDTGIGIAPEDLARVFEKFFRAKSAEQSTIQGTGLGLPMARYIVEKHRGRIELSSELGVGTEFRVYLPVVSVDSDDEGGSSLLAVDAAMR